MAQGGGGLSQGLERLINITEYEIYGSTSRSIAIHETMTFSVMYFQLACDVHWR